MKSASPIIMSQQETLAWIAQLFEVPTDKVTSETDRIDIPAWDSLGVLVLMAGLDTDFGVILSDDEVSSMNKVNDILEILRARGKVT